MTAENWLIIKQILQEVLNLPPPQRKKFLAKSGLPAKIKEEVESLLEFEESSADFMSATAGGLTGELVTEKKSFVGEKIGAYEIVGELGFGGMGAVYLARRADGKFEQRVAVKMLRREYNIAKIRRHFEREKEILAKLDHPFIARLLDTGTTADGVPFLVMEFVEGMPVDEFCVSRRLALKERLKLFNKICDAVSFAHRNLVIHRDLKPSNILVTEQGEPKLLDFGISKLLDAEGSEDKTVVTLLGAMTPKYASPEQIKGETISTATDIYSLGVVLYELLTGERPYKIESRLPEEVAQVILTEEPLRPSSVVSRSLEKHSIAKAKKGTTDNEQRTKSLRGDLDNIILKALRKEPERRYKTVEQFSADIWRHLDGLPVSARPATAAYRANKFIKRNKISVIASVLIFLSLIGGIAVALWQAREARAHARRSEIETQKAKEEQAKSEKVTKFTTKIINYANPLWYAEGAKFGKDARVIDAINDLSEKIDIEFAAEPDIAAELHHRFAFVIAPNAGSLTPDEQKARVLFHARRALDLRKQFYGEKHELVAKDMVYLYWARGIEESERASYLMSAIQMMRDTNRNNLNLPYMLEDYSARLMMPGAEKTHEQFRNAVLPSTNENKYQIAEQMLREALAVWKLYYPSDHSVILNKNCWLAYTLAKQDKWVEFDEPYQICKQIETKSQNAESSKNETKYLELVENVLKEKKN